MLNYKKNLLLYLGVCFFLLFLSINIDASVLGNRKIKTLSDKKIVNIEKMVTRSFEQNADSQDYDAIKSAVIDEVNEVYPIESGKEIKKVNYGKIKKEAEEKSTLQYPLTSKQLREKYNKEAEEKFVPAKINDVITVKYRRGRDELIKVTGEYRGFNRYNNGIKIGRKEVPVFDLLSEDRVKFIKNYRELIKKNYVRDNIKKYLQEKEEYCVQLITDSLKQIGKDNEAAGYINAWYEWRSPADVADMVFQFHKLKLMKKNKEIAEGQSVNNTNKNNSSSTASKLSGSVKKDGALNEVLEALE